MKLNRLCFRMMGDMNWHAHCGIFTYPVQVAVQHRIPLIIWGEHGFTDLGGMFSLNDFVEFTAKFRLEHALRGYDWHDMVEETEGLDARRTCCGRSTRATTRSTRSACAASTSATTSTGRPTPRPS